MSGETTAIVRLCSGRLSSKSLMPRTPRRPLPHLHPHPAARIHLHARIRLRADIRLRTRIRNGLRIPDRARRRTRKGARTRSTNTAGTGDRRPRGAGTEPAAVSCAPAISRPTRPRSMVRAGYASDSSPREMTAMRSAISKISSRSWLITSTAAPAPGHVDERLANERGGARVHPPGGLVDHHHPRGPASSSRPTTNFWRLPPESALRLGVLAARALHVETLDHPARVTVRVSGRFDESRDSPVPRSQACRVRSTFSERTKLGHRTVPEPLLRDEGGPEAAALGHPEPAARRRRRCRTASAAGARSFTGERLEELGLPVAGHPRDRDDLAAAHVDRDGSERNPERAAGRQGQVRDR